MGKAPEFLRGVWAPIPTPFVDGEVSIDNLQRNVQMWLTSPLHGLVALGSTGEFPHLRFEEKLQVIAAAVEAAEERPVMAGTGCPSTLETIELTIAAAERGARAVLVVTPYYYKKTVDEEALYQHYASVADASPVPVLLYHIPQLTGVEMSPRLVAELAQHPNIVGMKDSSGYLPRFAAYAAAVPEGFALFTGTAALLLPALQFGAAGGILAFANVAPWECCDIYRLFQEGRRDEAAALQRKVAAVSEEVSRYGIPAVKALLDMLGYFGGEPRRPLLPVTEEALDHIRGVLKQYRMLGC